MTPTFGRALRSAMALLVAGALLPGVARGALSPRFQADLLGDVTVLGSTLAFDCGAGVAPPASAATSCAGQLEIADSAPDLYWRDGLANPGVTALQARTSATLVLPPGAVVVHARLYWAALRDGAAADTTAVLDFRDGPTLDAAADASWVVPAGVAAHPTWHFYQSTADVTDYVAAWGAGGFRVTDVEAIDLVGVLADRAFSAWTLVVVYEAPGAPLRTVALHDGLTPIDPGGPGSAQASVAVTGFTAPAVPGGRLTVLAYEGDAAQSGDRLTIDGVARSNAVNPADGFFNSSRSSLGVAQVGTEDIPALSGQPGSMAGSDLDTVDVGGLLAPGATSLLVGVDSTGDAVLLGGVVASVATRAPHFPRVAEEVLDLDGGVLLRGDQLRYTIRATNQGTDPAAAATLEDVLDEGLELVPGTLEIVAGGAAGLKTEAAGDDEADYDAATRTITWRIGSGAGPSAGGALAPGATVEVRFTARPVVSARPLPNQATLRASGRSWRADGDPQVRGEQPVTITAGDCLGDLDCGGAAPHCNPVTHACVGCLTDADCGDPARPACLPAGACAQCSATNTSQCGGSTPACEVASGACVVCIAGPAGAPGSCPPEPASGCGCAGAGGGGSAWALLSLLLLVRPRRRAS